MLAEILTELEIAASLENVQEAAEIVGEKFGGYEVQVAKPPADSGAARKLRELEADSSDVTAIIDGVDVRLDIDQLKHQHKDNPIGTRHKGGGNRFNATATAGWHREHTLRYMAGWAAGLRLVQGDKIFHGQLRPVEGIHYEGYCLLANGTRYVLFHCYPADDSDMLGPKG